MNTQTSPISKTAIWTGRILSALTALLLIFSGIMKLMKPPAMMQSFGQFGFSESSLLPLGVVEIVCAVIYVIPRTAVLGAILMTGFLGGATAASARIGQPFIAPVIVGVLVWGGLFLRDKRLRALLPLYRKE